ncbi:MAG: sterol desaturase family protein [Pseudomonadota bacterium]
MVDILSYAGLALIPAFILLDAFRGHRQYKRQRTWRVRGIVVTAAAVWLSMLVASGWAALLGDYSLLDLSGLGTLWGVLVGLLVYEFVHYWYHRSVHRYDALWRLAHQMHHSAERVDAFGAYYLHPVDVVCFTSAASLVFVPLLGLDAVTAALASALLIFNAMFQHANVRTPHWLGYFIQRPESHCVHHGRGIHHYNYSDLPLWDIVFGTFVNPRDVDGMAAGFYDGASARVPEMLLFRDVSLPKGGPAVQTTETKDTGRR